MTDADIICGITIDLTPVYRNRDDWARCREYLVSGKEAHPTFRTILGRCGAESLTRVLVEQLGGEMVCHVRCQVFLVQFDSKTDLRDVFCVDMDVMGDLDRAHLFAPIVAELATSKLLCQSLRAAAEAFSTQTIPAPTIVWNVEFSESRF